MLYHTSTSEISYNKYYLEKNLLINFLNSWVTDFFLLNINFLINVCDCGTSNFMLNTFLLIHFIKKVKFCKIANIFRFGITNK